MRHARSQKRLHIEYKNTNFIFFHEMYSEIYASRYFSLPSFTPLFQTSIYTLFYSISKYFLQYLHHLM
jgi:hypothetical protein